MFVRVVPLLASFLTLVSVSPSFAAHAVATAEVGHGVLYYWNANQPSKKAAEQEVMKTCSESAKKNKHTAKCKFIGAADGPAYIAFFHTKDGSGFGISSNADRQQAINDAYAYCSKQGECPDTAAKVVLDEGEQKPRPATSAASDNCRPRTGQIRCRSNCVNGNCVVEYENGCKIRVQVSPRFDPFSNQWTYPSPSC